MGIVHIVRLSPKDANSEIDLRGTLRYLAGHEYEDSHCSVSDIPLSLSVWCVVHRWTCSSVSITDDAGHP